MTLLTSSTANQLIAEQGTDVVIPDIYTSIVQGAFSDAQLTSVVIPESVTSIEHDAFHNNQLTSVVIPDSVEIIGGIAFSGNPLTSIDLGSGLQSIGFGAFYNPWGENLNHPDVELLIIPDSVTEIEWYGLYGLGLKEVVLSKSLTTIEPGAFANNKLQTVVIPDSVTSIQGIGGSVGGFSNNDLIEIKIPDSVETIGGSAFRHNQLTSVDLGEGVQSIGEAAFKHNQLVNVAIPDSVIDIEAGAFDENPLETVSISASAIFDISVFPKGVDIIVRGSSPIGLNRDGFVDGVTNYQMWTPSGGVDLTNRRGRTFSDDTSRKWDAIKAVQVDGGFSVLIEGHRNKEGKHKVAFTNEDGVISGATRWLDGNQMFDEGYEDLFAMDFNGNNRVGY